MGQHKPKTGNRRVRAPAKLISRVDRHQIARRRRLEACRVSRVGRFRPLTGPQKRCYTFWPYVGCIPLCGASVAVFFALTALNAGDAPFWTAFDDIGEAVAALVATAALVVRVRRERRSRCPVPDGTPAGALFPLSVGREDEPADQRAWFSWALLSVGVAMWAVGEIGWSVYEVGFGIVPETPSWLDGPFLFAPALVIVGLLLMVRTPARRLSQLRAVLEGVFIAGGLFLSSWVLVIGPVMARSSYSTLTQVVNLAYPALDVIALAAVLFVALRRRDDAPSGIGLLGLGVIFMAIGDTVFWYLSVTLPRFPGVTPLDSIWIAAFALIALAALTPPARRRTTRGIAGGLLPMAPLLPAAIGVGVLTATWLAGGVPDPLGAVVVILALLLMVAVALRLIATYENRLLAGDLERRVKERTAQLRATERYYRALVQHSSDSIMVVDSDLQIQYASDSLLDALGRSADRLTGRPLDSLGAGASGPLTEALATLATRPGQAARVQWSLEDDAGRERQAESMITNMLGDAEVSGFVLNTRDVTDRAALEDQLRDQAFHDSLTGLPNRALLRDRAAHAFARSMRTQNLIAAMVIDIDGFKWVNDTQGHQIGDALLCAFAQRLDTALRRDDTVCRIGGDEFVALIDSVTSADEAGAIAQRLCETIRAPFVIDGNEHAITASLGVALGTAAETDFERLLADADQAMYAVKTRGKNAAEMFDPNLHREARERFKLEAEMRRSIEDEDFLVYYQPIFTADTERLFGFEALVRWKHPHHGLIPPDRFIPLAEESGLIVPLGQWVLDQALAHASAWNRNRARDDALTVTVNISVAQLNRPGFASEVQRTLACHEIAPALVILEITESALIEDAEAALAALHALRQLGVRLAIDDFGTGYASLSYLERMPVEMLKIDRSFIAASDHSPRALDLLKAIHDIGQTLSLETLAEGVETRNQLETIQSLGFNLAQGYLFSRPLPHDEADSLATRAVPQRPR
jgi:diguanylate cyclase (GGDEF)-like protein/PAS domain S-box-containing protein